MLMKSVKMNKVFLYLLTPLLMMVSCRSNEWEEHYYAEITEKSELSIYEYLKSQPELSKFTQMIELTGYDKLLTENQTFTVWAPTNTSLEGFDMNNSDLLLKTVRNHITRFSVPSSGISSKPILMMNNKWINFGRNAGVLNLGGKTVTRNDIAVSNGMIHVIGEYVPYVMNIWEYVAVAPGIDSLRTYINSLTTREFDVQASYVDGVLMDSVFTFTNRVLTRLGRFSSEDSTYTAVLPDNQAWVESYNRISPFFKTLPEDGGAEAQMANARWVMVRDLFFPRKLTLPLSSDSIRSTFGSRLSNGSQILPAAAPAALSNGLAYTANTLNHKPKETWNGVIRVEAESTAFGRTSKDYEITNFSSIGTGADISGRFYINARSLSNLSTARIWINFPIPNTLSGKYNVYCVFVPLHLTDTTNTRSYKVKFSLNYDYVEGKVRDSVWVGNTGFTKTVGTAKQFITEKKEISKVLVLENYEFPFANLVTTGGRNSGDMITGSKIRVGLRVENAAGTTTSERLNFSRDLRIDCILLEPVE